MPNYKVNNETYTIPDNEVELFESDFPDAQLHYQTSDGEKYTIYAKERKDFLADFPDATELGWKSEAPEQEPAGQMPKFDPEKAGTPPVPMFDDKPNAIPLPQQEKEYNTTLAEGFKQEARNLGAGVQALAGESLNLFSGTSLDDQSALRLLKEAEKAGMSVADYTKARRMDMLRSMGKTPMDEGGRWSKEEAELLEQDAKILKVYEDALKAANGNVNQAKKILEEQAQDLTRGDAMIGKAAETLSQAKENKGWAWFGGLLPQMAGNASAIALGYLTKGRSAGLSSVLMGTSRALGLGSMAGLTASTAGMSMVEAREKGASTEDVWAVGMANAAIEWLTEKIPFDTYTKKIYGAVKSKLSKGVSEVLSSQAGREELERLLVKANQELGGKLFSGKNLSDYIKSIAEEAGGEAIAEALQTITPIIYLNPEEYPELSDVIGAAWEGAKGGLVMGAMLGGASKATEHALNKDRRKSQGYVDVAVMQTEGSDPEVVEVLSVDDKNGIATVLQGGEAVEVKKDAIEGDRHRFTYAEFENARLTELEDEAIDNETVTEGQAKAAGDRVAITATELDRALAGLSEEQKQTILNDAEKDVDTIVPEDANEAYQAHREALRREREVKGTLSLQQEKAKLAIRDELTEKVGGQFWREQTDAAGDNPLSLVETGMLTDGTQVYIVSEVNEAGEALGVTEDGRKMVIKNDMLQDGTQIMTLTEFIDQRYAENKGVAEQTRMLAETERRNTEVMSEAIMGSRINLGTEEAPRYGTVNTAPNADGVIVLLDDGGAASVSMDELANILGKGAILTDAELASAESAEILGAEAALKTERAQNPQQVSSATDEAVVSQKTAEEAMRLPLKADGSVDQTTLWNQDPEKWAQWNDEQRQDGGANSLAYINGAISREQTKLSEMVSAYNAEPDFDARNAMESELAVTQERLNRLTALQQKYAPQVAQQDHATEQTASTEETQAAQSELKPRERSVESEVARLYDLGLSDEEVVANLDAKVAKAQKALDAQSKKAPKMGADENAYIAKKREHQQKMQELQQELDFATAASKAVNETLAQQSQAPEAPGTVAMEKDPEPQNAVEFAARELGLKEGGIKLQRQSFSEHTGYGTAEMKKFFGLFKSKQDGGMTIEQAGEKLMEMDRENNTGFFDQNDPNAGMNAILDALGAVNTIGELRSYVVRQRQAEVQKEADAAYSAMMADYEAAHGMSAEEVAAYDAVMNAEAIQKGLNETEYNELNSIFAEEISEYDTTTEESFGQSDGEVPSDVERGGEAVPEGSDNVLQSPQSDYTAAEGTAPEGEQSTQDADDVQSQDGNPQVQPAAVESSLDEDMPDFTNSASAYFPSEEMKQKFSTMRARINDWAQKLGVQVRIMETLDDVINQSAREQILKGGKVYGYFDPATGEVTFYLPDFLSLHGRELTEKEFLSEIDKTYIHEVVAHRGLRGLLGEDKYGELCDMVWDGMTEQQKANFLNYPGVNGNSRISADEFIAHFAENVDYNDNRTLWDKIVDFIKDLLTFDNRIEISNEKLAELLRHSYRNLAKSAASIDTNVNQQAEGSTVFRAANDSLVGMHNISEDKLRKALKQGGLANPSTAVVNIAEYMLDEYGDISLIMPSSLVDATTGDNIGTYTGDAWTPTYPPISRKVDNIGWKVIKDLIRSVVSEDSPLYHDIINGLENYLEDNRSSKMEFVFLKEKGIEPEIAYKGADGFVGMRNLEAVLGVQGLRDGFESYEKYKSASPMAKRAFNMWLDAAGDKQAYKELKEQLKKEPKLAEVLKLNEDVSFTEFDSFTYNIFRKEQDAGKIDTYDTLGAAARYVDANNLRGEFEAWLESLMEQAGAKEVFFAGYTRDGDRIYKDNTLENVSRHMRLQNRTNAYDDHGLSATKSALLQRLTSLSQIRKNKARLQNESAYNKEYDVLRDRLFDIISSLADMQEISSNQFMNIDYAESRLQDAITKKNPVAYLNKEYGYDIAGDSEFASNLTSFIKDVQKMPAKYFETKFERPVYLNEFAAAVMPTTTSEDLKQAVSEAGLPIFEYDSSVEGSRKEATLKATEGEGIRFRAIGEKGAANLDKAEEATIRLDNLAVARQMEKSGKDAKAIKLATGWERGADKLWRYEVSDDFDLTELENRLQESLNDGLSKAWGILYPSDLGELTKAYPDFNVDIMVWVGEEFENTGEYSPATEGDETTFGRSASIEVKAKTVADIKDVLVHEIQHAIQEKEGFAEGGSVFGLKDKLSSALDSRVARIKELRAEGRDAEADELMSMSKGLAEAVINNDADTYQNYRKLVGEVEARNVSARLRMSEQERRESLLSETEDVAREDQIVLMDGLGVSALIGNINNVPTYDQANGTELGDWLKFVDTGVIAKNKTQFYIANCGAILNKYGIHGKINASRKAINPKRHTQNADHRLGVQEWIDVVDSINDPLYITQYNNTNNSFRIYTIAKINGKNICVGVDVNTNNGVNITKITTIFGRDISKIYSSPKETVLYDKAKATKGISGSNNLHLYPQQLSVDKDTNNSENDNTLFRTRITAEQDKAYMDAVKAGDMETVAKMVAEAVKLAMPNTTVVDENGYPREVYRVDEYRGNRNKYTNVYGGVFYADAEEYFDHSDTGHKKENAEPFYINTEGFFDPMSEMTGLMVNSWAEILGKKSEFEKYDIEDESDTDRGFYNDGEEVMTTSTDGLALAAQRMGYKGVILRDVPQRNGNDFTEYAVFNSNAIKSAKLVTYDDSGNVIPLSERFNPENEDIRFRMRGENESAMDFTQSEVDAYYSKYNSLAETIVSQVNEEVAREHGYTLEELKKIYGVYESEKDRITIFAHEENYDGDKLETSLFHESIHKLAEFYPYLVKAGEWMYNNADRFKTFAELKDIIVDEYEPEWHHEEMLCYVISACMNVGVVEEVMTLMPQEHKRNVEQILKEIGYDTTTEGGRRKARRSLSESTVSEDLRDAEGKSESGRSGKETKGSSRAEFSAEERRVINDYFPGTFAEPIEQARQEVDQNPTDAQKEAGNYRKGHLRLDGYNITIENPKGSVRRGTDSKGNAWENTLNNDYGYIRDTEGVDGDHIDVYLSDNPTEGNVFVIDQVNPETREFDEHKVMYGFNSAEEARDAYLANFSEGWNGLGTITEVSKDEFKKWIESSHRKTKPFSEYKSVKIIGAQSEGEEMKDDFLPSTGTPTDEVVTNGLRLTPSQTATLAGNIFSALPEESRERITDGLGSIADLQDAILQIPTSLATKESWSDEDRAVAEVVAEQMTKMAGDMTRPFSAPEALWLLYNNLNRATDLVSEASRALVRRNLGFDDETLAQQEQAKEDVRFRSVSNANNETTAKLYNKGAVNVWTRLKESFVDMNASVDELVKAMVKRSGKEPKGFEDIRLALNQQSSKGLAAMEDYELKFLNPMLDAISDIIRKTKKSYDQIVRYVILKHGLERNDSFAKRDAREYYGEMFKKVADRMKNQSHAQRVVNLSEAKKALAAVEAKMVNAKGDKLERLKEEREAAMFEVTVAELVLRGNEKQNESDLKARMDAIDAGTDAKYQELRDKDYSGITSMFYDQLDIDRNKYDTEEEYQAALMEAKQDKYATLADVEAAAQAEVDAFEKDVNTAKLWKRINAATKETLRQQYEANMISKEQYETLRDMFQFYVPLRGFADNTAEDMYTYYRKPNSTGYTKPILGAEGRKTEAESPFGWIAAMANSAIASNVKNEAKLALFYFVSNRPDNGIATISKTWFEFSHTDPVTGKKVYKPAYPPFTEGLSSDQARADFEQWQEDMKAKRAAGQAYESGQRLNLGNAVVNISDRNRPEHIVNVKVAGKDYTIIINGNPRAAQAINGDLNIEATAGDYSKVFGPILRWMSSVNTSYNPEFWITNMQRDMLFTLMNVTASQSPAYRKKFFSNYAKAFKVISMAGKNERGTLGNSYIEKMYQEFVENGGVTGYTQIKDNEVWEKDIENYMKSANMEDKKMGRILSGTKDALHVFHRFGESMEQVSRFAAFLTSREMGMSMAESINSAKEITVNFNRKGSGKMISWEETKKLTGKNGKPLNDFERLLVWGISSMAPLGRRFIMFFNASIQGLNAMYKLYKNNPSKMTAWSLGYLSLGVMQALVHAMMDDDDDYLDIPQYERRTSLMLGGNGTYFKWALPQEARAFYALGDLAVESIMGRNPHQNVIMEALKIGADIAPVNPTEGWKAFLPSVAVPFVELMINEDWKGDPIYNEQKWLTSEERKRTAKAAGAYQGTGKMYIWISEALNNISGGDDYDAGLINIQPEKMEHLVQSAFGGTIRTADKFFNTIMAAIDPEEEWTVKQTPFLNRLLTINDERFRNVHVNEVYDYYKAEAEHAKTLQKKYTKDRDMDAYRDLMNSDEMQWSRIYERYKKPIMNLQEKIKVAEGTAERRELMKQQDELKRRMIKEISELSR